MARISMPSPAELTAQQQEVCDEVVRGKRGKIPAPMIAWLRNPELARRTQLLGELLRYDTTLAEDATELAIIICGRHWTSHLEWKAHKAYALQAGIAPKNIADIAARRVTEFEDPRLQTVYEVATTLLSSTRVPAVLYTRAVEQLGERGVVDLVAILGYYCFASLTLNTFELGLPENVAPELEDPDFA